MKKIVAICEIDDTQIPKDCFEDYVTQEFGWLEESGITLSAFSEAPSNTSIDEIKDAIVSNRSKDIEEEYSEAFEELA